MAMVIVILLNVLIAQLSYTYSEAKSNAKLQYAIDRMRIVTRLEHSRFARFVSSLKARLHRRFLSRNSMQNRVCKPAAVSVRFLCNLSPRFEMIQLTKHGDFE